MRLWTLPGVTISPLSRMTFSACWMTGCSRRHSTALHRSAPTTSPACPKHLAPGPSHRFRGNAAGAGAIPAPAATRCRGPRHRAYRRSCALLAGDGYRRTPVAADHCGDGNPAQRFPRGVFPTQVQLRAGRTLWLAEPSRALEPAALCVSSALRTTSSSHPDLPFLSGHRRKIMRCASPLASLQRRRS